ncbi:hypothetical protein DMC14_000320 [Metamycoplasma phocicerebrale]|uniref:HipA-like C-terminal domain-containing protein n=1 Tax=Metamycoplasma phocicerebrale TaxID=142649 RepID=A0A3T0TT73_9BACT|nr:hypothetical protein [Metamycoplasma phocicerebrale]AZZ65254.1 hypothetical protein DMC14_000320 [Metamycoplasma phocicerebrale]
MKKFSIKLKNKLVLSLDWNEINETFENITFSKEFSFLKEFRLFQNDAQLNSIILFENILPKQRSKKIQTINKNSLNYYLNDYGLNLNNAFWILPYDKQDLKWEENNYFHKYKLDFTKALLNTYIYPSPNIYTVGEMEKFWFFDKGELFLAKKGTPLSYDVQSEYLAYQVIKEVFSGEKQKIIEYKLRKNKNELYSISKIFTNENTSFIPLSWLINYDETNKVNIINQMKKIYGNDELEDLMILDAIILNIDRHLGNIGILVDNNNLSKIDNAPIFDNGKSLVFDYPLYKSSASLVYLENYLNIKPKLYNSFKEQFLDNVQPRHAKWYEKLKKFKFQNDFRINLNLKYLNKVQEIFDKQLNVFKEILIEKEYI